CAPSRACIYTGLYPHLNGVTKNGDQLDSSLNMIQKILKTNGYYTGFVGKYGQFLGTPTGFNWWATSDGDIYNDALYTINGVDTAISGSIIDIYPQLAKTFLNSVPEGKDFVLFYFPRAPHLPTVPRSVDSLLYIEESIPYPSNYKFYKNNYPSFYTDHKWIVDSLQIDSIKRLRFQTIKGTDDNLDSLLSWIEEKGILDSTLVVFTSDNGYLLGEHKLNEKILALEESIRLPLFIRYPKWFSSGSIITDDIASNLDFATTFLDFAGIENTFGFQGLSLHKIYTGATYRKNFLYESGYDPNTAKLRAVRTLNDIFIRSYCKTTCEEYYNLVADPKEDSNLIFSSQYQTIIAAERILLDSLRTSYNDIIPSLKKCNLVSDGMRDYFIDNDIDLPNELAVIPTLATQSFHIYFENTKKLPAQLKVFDMVGKEIVNENMGIEYFYSQPDCGKWNNGIYNIVVNQGRKIFSQTIVVNH
ncbi:MAG: sulfatase-like hydrolase/transferase, partial [Chitinophagales bacterium]|nr:sulfatase-like hydrolase/transferase [Chitinophagales bacterium]